MPNTHYAVLVFSGDPACEHEDPELNGMPPSMGFLACGSEAFCWGAAKRWTLQHPLRQWENVEILARGQIVIQQEQSKRLAYENTR